MTYFLLRMMSIKVYTFLQNFYLKAAQQIEFI